MKKTKKKFEFSKAIVLLAVIVLFCIGIWSVLAYYSLTELAINSNATLLPDASLPIACITTILGTILTYCLYQGALKNSRNKYKVDSNGDPIKETTTDSDFPVQNPTDCDYN